MCNVQQQNLIHMYCGAMFNIDIWYSAQGRLTVVHCYTACGGALADPVRGSPMFGHTWCLQMLIKLSLYMLSDKARSRCFQSHNLQLSNAISIEKSNYLFRFGPRMSVLYRDISRKQYIASFGNIAILQYSENIVIF